MTIIRFDCNNGASVANKKLQLLLPVEMHEALFAESRERGVPATRLVRSVLEEWLQERRSSRRREEIRQFAQACAGTELDIVSSLEASATEDLQQFYGRENEAR